MRVSGAETTSVCASVFIGQTEAPLTVRPYISKMTESELITMMIGGMAHIAGGVLAAINAAGEVGICLCKVEQLVDFLLVKQAADDKKAVALVVRQFVGSKVSGH